MKIVLEKGFERRAFRVFTILISILVGMFMAATSDMAAYGMQFPTFILTGAVAFAGACGLSYVLTNKIW